MLRIRWIVATSCLILLMIGLGLLRTATDRFAIGESIPSPPEDSPVASFQDPPYFSDCPPLKFFGFPEEGPILRVPQEYPTIQAAIDAAPNEAKILIAPGTYQENLVIRKSVRLQGIARDHVILKSAKEDLSTVLIVGTSHPLPSNGEYFRVLIENLTIAESSGGLGAIEVIGLPRVLIRDNTFRDNWGPSIFAAALPGRDPPPDLIGHVFICRNLFDGRGVEVLPAEMQVVSIIGNTFRNAEIRVGYARASVPWNNPVRRFAQPRVYIYKNTIQADRFLGWGISLYDAQHVVIQENTIEGADFAGVGLSEESEAVIKDNLIRGNKKTGVMIGEGCALLKGNRIEGNGNPSLVHYTGGVLIGSLAQVELEGNEIVENLSWGIITTNTASMIACRGNRVTANHLGNYGWYSINPPIEPQPSPELKQKCEGG